MEERIMKITILDGNIGVLATGYNVVDVEAANQQGVVFTISYLWHPISYSDGFCSAAGALSSCAGTQ